VDASGGRVPGTSIALINNATGLHYSAISDGLGQFSFELLPPGAYLARAIAEKCRPNSPQSYMLGERHY
jgi:hypothetical protein